MGHLGHDKICARCAEHRHAMRVSCLCALRLEKLPRPRRWLRWGGNILPGMIALARKFRDELLVIKYLEHIAFIDEGLCAIKEPVENSAIGHMESNAKSHRVSFLFSSISLVPVVMVVY
jgi:hypothetical protein